MKAAIILGLIQFLLFWTIIGWVWAIYNGFKIYQNSK